MCQVALTTAFPKNLLMFLRLQFVFIPLFHHNNPLSSCRQLWQIASTPQAFILPRVLCCRLEDLFIGGEGGGQQLGKIYLFF